MNHRTKPLVDTASRAISIFGLIIALGVLALQLSEMRKRADSQEDPLSTSATLAKQAKDYSDSLKRLEAKYQTALAAQDQRNEEWNTSLNASLSAFNEDAKSLLTQIQQKGETEANRQRVAFRQALQGFQSAAELPTNQDSKSTERATAPTALDRQLFSILNRPKKTDPADIRPEISGRESEISSNSDAMLRVVSSSLRPNSDSSIDQRSLLVENTADHSLTITRIRFRPRDKFELTDNAATDISATVQTSEIVFEPTDNHTTTPGYHGTYDRLLLTPVVIPSGERRAIELSIADARHTGWGLIGAVVLDYGDKQALDIKTARVVFE